MSSPSSSSRHLDSRSRLERAKYQYENLLLHAGSNLLIDDSASTSIPASSTQHNAFDKSQKGGSAFSNTMNASRATPESMFGQSRALPPTTNSPSYTEKHSTEGHHYSQLHQPSMAPVDATTFHEPHGFLNQTRFTLDGEQTMFIDEHAIPPLSNEEMNDIILRLQEENERLKYKLNSVIETAEKSLQEAQETNDNVVHQYEQRVAKLESNNKILLDENDTLKSALRNTQTSLDVERENMQKTLKILDQMQKRSRDYLEVQRKSHQILTAPEGLHYTMYVGHKHS